MTGTAMTEAAEFMDIYKLDVLEVPTNMPSTGPTPTTRSIVPQARKTRRSLRSSRTATTGVSPCWWHDVD